MCIEATKVFDFLNNASVSAFLGAFAAYFLVAFTDWRRRHQKVKLLNLRVQINQELAQAKLETARTNIALIQEDGRFMPSPVMRFPAEDVRVLQREALDMLTAPQLHALDALIYWMEAIDGLFQEAYAVSRELEELAKSQAPDKERMKKAEALLREYKSAERNLVEFIELSGHYIQGRPDRIINFKKAIE